MLDVSPVIKKKTFLLLLFTLSLLGVKSIFCITGKRKEIQMNLELALLVVSVAFHVHNMWSNRRVRKTTLITKSGERKIFLFRNSQLERERNEKSVLSSEGFHVAKEGNVWRELP